MRKKLTEYFISLIFVGFVVLLWLSIQLGFWFEDEEYDE